MRYIFYNLQTNLIDLLPLCNKNMAKNLLKTCYHTAFIIIASVSILYFVVCFASQIFLQNKKINLKNMKITNPDFIKVLHVKNLSSNDIASVKRNVIRIAAVVCSKPGVNLPRKEAAVMIKSVIISSIMYQIQSNLEFHLFLEHKSDQQYFRDKLKSLEPSFYHGQVVLNFHSANNAVPDAYKRELNDDPQFRCMYVRIFFPKILIGIDRILYLDTDIIVTGNTSDLWSYFLKMNNKQMIGVAPDFAANNPKSSIYFTDIPHPPPKGLNSGLQLMSLKKMREYNWEEKIMQLYMEYGIKQNIPMNDQKLLNIMLYFNKDIFFELPCQFNFWATSCINGHYCDGALQDPDGIQVIHGAASSFNRGRAFAEIFAQYTNFQLDSQASTKEIKNKLLKKIRNLYQGNASSIHKNRKVKKSHHKKCDGILDKLLYKSFFKS